MSSDDSSPSPRVAAPMPDACKCDESDRARQARATIKQTVERVVPPFTIDQTRVLSDEDLAQLRAQTAQKLAARELVQEAGSRAELRSRLRDASERATKSGPYRVKAKAPPAS